MSNTPILATKGGITFVVGYLFALGAMCNECGFGTRATSKRWARCKQCGARVRRRSREEVEAIMDEALAARSTPTETNDA